MHAIIHTFIHAFIHACICLFIHIHMLVHSFIHLFLPSSSLPPDCLQIASRLPQSVQPLTAIASVVHLLFEYHTDSYTFWNTSVSLLYCVQVVVHQPHQDLHQQLLQMLSVPNQIEEQAASQTSSPMSNKEDSPEPNWGDFNSRPQAGYHNELDNSFSGLKLGLDTRVPSSVTIR